MISSLLHLVGLRPRVYYTLTNFRGGAKAPLAPPLNTPMDPHCSICDILYAVRHHAVACPGIRKGGGGGTKI